MLKQMAWLTRVHDLDYHLTPGTQNDPSIYQGPFLSRTFRPPAPTILIITNPNISAASWGHRAPVDERRFS